MKSARRAKAEHSATFWQAKNPDHWMAADAQLAAYTRRQDGFGGSVLAEADDYYARFMMGIRDEDQYYA